MSGFFTRYISTQMDVHVSIDRVWDVLVDFDSYDQWNPFIIKGQGRPSVGRFVPITIQLPGQKPGPYRVRILACDPPHELRWLGHFKMPGLCNGNHVFQLQDLGAGGTRLIHAETFTGLLVPFIWPSLGGRFLQAFESVNNAVKARVE